MQVTRENTSDLTAIIKIELEPEDYKKKIDTQIKEYQHKANLPGFRPGKVPFGLVKKMVGKNISFDVINKLFSDSLYQYLIENKIDIMASPLPSTEKNEPIDLDVEGNYAFYFDIALAPEFEVNFADLKDINMYNIQPTEESLDKAIMDIRKRNGSYEDVNEVDENSMIYGNFFEIDEAGNAVENGKNNDAYLYAEKITEESEKNKIIGSKTDDVIMLDIDKVAKNEYEKAYMLGVKKEELASITTKYAFKIKKITANKPAELNEEFYSKVYPAGELKEFDAFKEKVKEELIQSYNKEAERKFVNDIIEQMQEKVSFALPEEFLKRYMVETDQTGKLTAENIDEEFEGQRKLIKWQLIENKIVKENNIGVTDADAKDFIKGYFKKSQEEHEHEHHHDHEHEHEHHHHDEDEARLDQIADTIMKNEQEVNRIKDKLFEDRLFDFFKTKVDAKEKAINFDDFVLLISK